MEQISVSLPPFDYKVPSVLLRLLCVSAVKWVLAEGQDYFSSPFTKTKAESVVLVECHTVNYTWSCLLETDVFLFINPEEFSLRLKGLLPVICTGFW